MWLFEISKFWRLFNDFPLFSRSYILGPPKTLSKNFRSKLSPTSTNILCLDFFLRKPKIKLYRQKLLFFREKFFFFDFFDHSDTHVVKKKQRNITCRPEWPENSKTKNVFEKINSFWRYSFCSSLRSKKSKQKSSFGVGESFDQTFLTSETVNPGLTIRDVVNRTPDLPIFPKFVHLWDYVSPSSRGVRGSRNMF